MPVRSIVWIVQGADGSALDTLKYERCCCISLVAAAAYAAGRRAAWALLLGGDGLSGFS